MIMRKSKFLAAVLFIVCGAVACARESNPDPARFAGEIEAFEAWDRQNSPPRDAALFIGSSSIRMWQTAESFPDFPVINRGFGGSVVADSNHFAERIVVKYRPRVIVFYAGDNDIAFGMSPQKVFADFQAFVRLVHARLPATHILYLPIKPSISRWKNWPEMKAANALVAELAKADVGLDYVDTATPMLGADGRPRKELLLDDGLHLNAKGYALWREILTPVLAEVMETDR
jgi:lysophospholipase L1-like esterase